MQKVYTLLSIDGGGIRGIFAIELLKLIMDELKKKRLQMHDVIDMYCGVSVGSIVASVLAKHNYSFFDTYKEQEDIVRGVFQAKTSLGPLIECKYFGWPKSKAIKDLLGVDTLLRDVKTNLLVIAADSKGREIIMHSSNPFQVALTKKKVDTKARSTDVLSVARYSVPDLSQKDTRNDEAHKESNQDVSSLPLWKIIDASTAAPIYFPPVEVLGKLCIDGGVVSTNPSIIGTHTLRKLLSSQYQSKFKEDTVIRVFSIGAGGGNLNSDDEEKTEYFHPMQYGLVTWVALGNFMDILTKTNDPIIESVMPALLKGSGRYMRADTTVKVAMDDVSPETFEKLRKNAKNTFAKHGKEIMRWLLDPLEKKNKKQKKKKIGQKSIRSVNGV